MSTPEGRVKSWLKTQLRLRLPDGFMYMPPGGAFGKAGMPDILYLWRGVLVAIETKSGLPGARPTALQLKQLQLISSAGGLAALMNGKDEAKLALIVDKARSMANARSIQ